LELKIKNVQLKDFSLSNVKAFNPELNIDIKWYQDLDSKKNNETYASIIGNKQDINNQLSKLPILSDRVRTLNNIPKSHTVGNVKKVIY